MSIVIQVALVVVAVIHVLPVIGVLGRRRLTALYAVPVDDANTELLLRHRAVLFAIVGGLAIAGAVHAPLVDAALVVAAVSVVSFLVLARLVGPVNAALHRVVVVDVVALVALLAATIARFAPGPLSDS